MIENRTFDELAVGDCVTAERVLTLEEAELSACLSGSCWAPPGLDPTGTPPGGVETDGLWAVSLITGLIDTRLPGPGTVHLAQALRFLRRVDVGDTITASLRISALHTDRQVAVLDCSCVNQRDEAVVTGTVEVTAPLEKIRQPRPLRPEVRIARHGRQRALLERTAGGTPIVTAIVHPSDAESVAAAVEAADRGLITPIFVGPRHKIASAAVAAKRDLTGFRIEDVPHSHAAASRAVELVRTGAAAMLMKGALHTDELMHAVLAAEAGLRTERRVSHAYLIDVPGYDRPLILTDAAINIAPTLAEKADITRNAIDLAHVLGIAQPKVAILAAVETVDPAMCSTVEAAALCKMSERGQIVGGIVDGPLAFDNAISPTAAREKGIISPVAGVADVLVVPDLEAGNMLAKQLIFLANADAAGIVLGARVPIVLTSRADSLETRVASCAVAVLVARARATPAAPVTP